MLGLDEGVLVTHALAPLLGVPETVALGLLLPVGDGVLVVVAVELGLLLLVDDALSGSGMQALALASGVVPEGQGAHHDDDRAGE